MFLCQNLNSKLSNHLISEITYQIYPTCYNLQYIIYFYTFIDSLQKIVSMIEINFTKGCEWVEIVKILFKGNHNWEISQLKGFVGLRIMLWRVLLYLLHKKAQVTYPKCPKYEQLAHLTASLLYIISYSIFRIIQRIQNGIIVPAPSYIHVQYIEYLLVYG